MPQCTIDGDVTLYWCNEPYERQLIVVDVFVDHASCSPGEFTCDDGTCIQVRLQCDGIPDCPDRSDEHGCGKIHCQSA